MLTAANTTNLFRIALMVLLLSLHSLGLAAHAATHTNLGDTVNCEVCCGGNKLDHAAADCTTLDAPRLQAARPSTPAPPPVRDPLRVRPNARGPPLSS